MYLAKKMVQTQRSLEIPLYLAKRLNFWCLTYFSKEPTIMPPVEVSKIEVFLTL